MALGVGISSKGDNPLILGDFGCMLIPNKCVNKIDSIIISYLVFRKWFYEAR